jgi:SanA protein
MKKYWKTATMLSVILLVVASYSIYFTVHNQTCSIYESVDEVPCMPVAIVFGAGVGTPILADRVATAVSLYKIGKISKILMTGDSHPDYDEPRAMRAMAIAAGVPKKDVVCDYAGFRTYDSLYRARDIFSVNKAILVTQNFHLPRAIFIDKHLGLSVIGVDATMHSYGSEQGWYELREILASEFAWLEVFTHHKPKFLGKKEVLFARDEFS